MDISSISIRRNLSKNFLRLTFLFALLLYITSFSQNIEPRFEHITVKDGLPEHTVVSILQDNLGYMWFSTQTGLVRYDGYEIHEYMNGNSWLSLYEDRNKDLWAGSWADGLYRFNRASESFDHYFHKDSDKFSISSDVIHSMFEDSKGRFWIATAKGLELFDRKAKKFRHFNFTDRIYSNELKSNILKSSNSNKRIASILKVGNNADLFHTFKLKKRTAVMIVMMGEAGYDYGWLTDSDGKIIFDYDYKKTLHAGGEFNNRIEIELLTLDEGIYQLHYTSNYFYSYEDQFQHNNSLDYKIRTGKKPDIPELWGIQVLDVTNETKQLKQLLDKISIVQVDSKVFSIFENELTNQIYIGTNSPGLWSSPVTVEFGEVENRILDEFALEQNYPNPFNPTTIIGYVLKEKTDAKLILLNAIGEEVTVLVSEEQDKGFHKVDFNASTLASGVYFYRLQAGDFVQTRKMILLK